MMFQRPQRPSNHSAPEYDPLAPNPFVPPKLPGGSVPSVRKPPLGQRGSASVPKKMNTQTNTQFNGVMKRNAARSGVQQIPALPGDPPRNSSESFLIYNDRVLRHRAGYPQPPKPAYTEGGGATMRAMPITPIPIIPDSPSPRSPSNAIEPMQRDYFGEQRQRQADLLIPGGEQSLATPHSMSPISGTGVPQRPQVDEGLLARLPSRSDRDRATMQPGGMGDGSTFDAMAAREREARLAPQRALAQREDVTAEDDKGFTRTVDRDPNSPTFGQATVDGRGPSFGPSVPDTVKAFIADNDGDVSSLYTENGRDARKALNESREPRRKARLAGEVYTDPFTGGVTDYGRVNEAREARQERKDAARELSTRAAQLQNYGRTGGIMVDPSGGIAGPKHVGYQATFGPNMSRNQAIRMAQGEVDREDLLQTAMKRADDKERMTGLKDLAVSGDRQAAAAYRREFGIGEDDPVRTEIDDAIASGAIPQAPKLMARIEATPVKDREQMLFQIERIIDSSAISRDAKELMIEEMYGSMTLDKINKFQNGTSYDKMGGQQYELTKKLMEFFGLTPAQRPATGNSSLPSNPNRPPGMGGGTTLPSNPSRPPGMGGGF
jgi:hypothetical protein